MKKMRKILGWTFGILLLLIALTGLFVQLFNWNLLRPMLNEKISAALHRPFAINGDLFVNWHRPVENGGLLPGLKITANQLEIGNPEWAKGKHLVALERTDFAIGLWPLLKKTVVIPSIDLTMPDAELERLADGKNNWTFDLGADDQQPSSWQLDIGSIAFDKGRVSFKDQQLKSDFEIHVSPLGKPIPFTDIVAKKDAPQTAAAKAAPMDYAFDWQAKGNYKGQAMQGKGKIGGLLALQSADQPFPIEADVHAGKTRINVVGTLTDPMNLGALDLNLKLSGATLSDLYRISGVTLPDTPPYSTDGRLIANLKAYEGGSYHYKNFNGRIGDSDIHGDLTYVMQKPRPKLSGTLSSNQLLFSDLAPLIGADTGDGAAQPQQSTQTAASQPGASGKVLPATEFRTERWRDMDAEIDFTGKNIVQSKDFPFTDLHANLLLDDGQLTLKPLRFGVAGGQLDTYVHLDGSKTPMRGNANLSMRKFELSKLFPKAESMQASFGEINGDIKISGTGNSIAALLGSADGELKALINGGRISRSLMELAGLNVGNYLTSKIFGDTESTLNCAAADMQIEKGVMTPKLFLVDTDTAAIHMTGNVDFGKETLGLDIKPESKNLRILSLRSPLYVKGTFGNPDIGVEATPLVARGAAMVALGAVVAPAAGLVALTALGEGEPENECAAVLKQISIK